MNVGVISHNGHKVHKGKESLPIGSKKIRTEENKEKEGF
jgi:hypothetical protein